ncbi:carbohydrate sulfotransferase 11-like [Ylistrum balloti]|uniref:carbohydrate sulfotransferase 11-like n=1 Tax=Ylistrum balloti TaxID=509963 RepID=UPI002905A3E5|nr:carbohydrate sulfotransferase 11-like [Ylistrum balloti]
MPVTWVKNREPKYFFAENYQIAFCKAPKSGTTFIGLIVAALKNAKTPDNIFHVNREDVHGKNEIMFSSMFKYHSDSMKTVLVTRNPYTRLFSAFVDKYYTLSSWGTTVAKRYRKRPYNTTRGYCGYNVTLQEMLDYVTSGTQIEEHTIPVSNLCKPCTVHYDLICKQETLNADMEHVLNVINTSTSVRQAIVNQIHGKGLEDTFYSWISSQLTYFSKFKQFCSDHLFYVETLWRALQFQGHIDSSFEFPAHEFKLKETLQAQDLVTNIMRLIKPRQISKSQSSMQKKRILAEAYGKIKPETLARIQRVYAQDFHLFGYDTGVPV